MSEVQRISLLVRMEVTIPLLCNHPLWQIYRTLNEKLQQFILHKTHEKKISN